MGRGGEAGGQSGNYFYGYLFFKGGEGERVPSWPGTYFDAYKFAGEG